MLFRYWVSVPEIVILVPDFDRTRKFMPESQPNPTNTGRFFSANSIVLSISTTKLFTKFFLSCPYRYGDFPEILIVQNVMILRSLSRSERDPIITLPHRYYAARILRRETFLGIVSVKEVSLNNKYAVRLTIPQLYYNYSCSINNFSSD